MELSEFNKSGRRGAIRAAYQRIIVSCYGSLIGDSLKPMKGMIVIDLRIDIGGGAVLDLSTAPHVLIAGATGSGKSVCMQGALAALLRQNSPRDLRLFIIDPKMVDYMSFRAAPQLVDYVSDSSGAERILKAVHSEMMARYAAIQSGAGIPQSAVILVWDELASLLDSSARRRLLPILCDILRLGRAAKVHLLLACQRPTADIVTGQVKSNCPTRISFRVASAIDSRVIIDRAGAEQLHGMGDGILLRSDGTICRFQGRMVSADEIGAAVGAWAGCEPNRHPSAPSAPPAPSAPSADWNTPISAETVVSAGVKATILRDILKPRKVRPFRWSGGKRKYY